MKRVFTLFTFIFLFLILVSCPQNDTGIEIIGAVTEKVVVEGTRGVPIDEVSLTIELTSGSFIAMKKGDTPISSWLTPFPSGLSVDLEKDVDEGATSLTLVFSGKSLGENLNTIGIEIPYQFFGNAKKSPSRVPIDTKGSSYHIIKKTIPSLESTVTIVGSTDAVLEDDIEFTISLTADTFNQKLASDLTDWFSPVIPGLKYTLKSRVNDSTIVIGVSGQPTKAIDTTPIVITIKSNATVNAMDVKLTDEQMKNSTIQIEDAAQYRWKWNVYDLASFAKIPQSDNVVLSANRALTTQTDGSALRYTDESKGLLNSGEGKTVDINNTGLVRHGYRFVGWTKDPVYKNIRYTDLNPTLIVEDGYKEGETENVINLYAVWEPSSLYYKLNDISKDGTVIPGVYKKALDDFEHSDYNYYNEIALPAEGYSVPHTIDDDGNVESVTLEHDFVIAEHPITGYMLDEIRSWGENRGYEIPLETVDVPTEDSGNVVGYGSKESGGIVEPLGDASHPVTFVSVSQAIVIANALTAYYNAHKESGETLKPAYMTDEYDDSTEIKTIDAAKKALEADPSGRLLVVEKNKGFRLPFDAEWDFASRVVGKSDYDDNYNIVTDTFVGSYYPMFQQSKTIPGKREANTDVPYPDEYSWYSENSYQDSDVRTTLGFSAQSLGTDDQYGCTLMSRKASASLVRNLSGNVKEWTVPSSKDDATYKGRGGSFRSSSSEVTIKSYTSLSPLEKNGEFGIRFVRSTS